MEEKIEKNRRKLFDNLRKLNNMTSEGKLKELEELFIQKSKGEGKLSAEFCLTGLEILMDRLMEVYKRPNKLSFQICKSGDKEESKIENK